jgi:hypothetical protein
VATIALREPFGSFAVEHVRAFRAATADAAREVVHLVRVRDAFLERPRVRERATQRPTSGARDHLLAGRRSRQPDDVVPAFVERAHQTPTDLARWRR